VHVGWGPQLGDVAYVGVDADAQRLLEARRLLAGCAYADRVELRPGRAERMPCAYGEADVVLIIAILQHVPDLAAVLKDVRGTTWCGRSSGRSRTSRFRRSRGSSTGAQGGA
jgi:2-polyprenyl-3-methyl-5-hydroxy-6-metoxy-1,4-benzoquinol methylase